MSDLFGNGIKSLSIPLTQALAEWGLIGGDSGYYNEKRDISVLVSFTNLLLFPWII